MAFLTDSFLLDFLTLCTTILCLLWGFYKWSFTYWAKRNVPFIEPSIPFGNIGPLIKQKISVGEQFIEFYKEFKSKGYKHGGVYNLLRPTYIPIDLDIIKNIMTKDFAHFVDHGVYFSEDDPLSLHLFNIEGDRWKNLRAKLTPTFTSGKMKMMFQTLVDCSVGLEKIINESVKTKQTMEIKEVVARFSTDIIGSSAFGIDINSLENPDSPFRYYGKRIFENTTLEALKVSLTLFIPPNILRKFKFKTTKQDVEDFFMSLVKKTVKYREDNKIFRKDFLHLLLQLKHMGKVSDSDKFVDENEKQTAFHITDDELAAQVFIFYVGGFETSSTTMSFAFLELARNQDVQDKLREEIITVLQNHGGKYTYEAFIEMKYLEQVVNETLRKYPPAPFLTRVCNKEYPVSGTSLTLEKGTVTFIPIMGIQNDPEYFPNPEKFMPERFSDENKSSIHKAAWMPFGDGPRNCIGSRFGMLQTKIGIATIIKNHRVTLNTQKSKMDKLDPLSFVTTVDGGVWVDLEKV